jgi:hypothetical protein
MSVCFRWRAGWTYVLVRDVRGPAEEIEDGLAADGGGGLGRGLGGELARVEDADGGDATISADLVAVAAVSLACSNSRSIATSGTIVKSRSSSQG